MAGAAGIPNDKVTAVAMNVAVNAPEGDGFLAVYPCGAVPNTSSVNYRSGQTVANFEGQQGFLRGSLRALARSRQRAGQGPEQPFVLTGHTDGRLVLLDPVTGDRINLESFGPTNAAVFAQLRPSTPPASTPTPTSGGTP